jgi:hypothetical protein
MLEQLTQRVDIYRYTRGSSSRGGDAVSFVSLPEKREFRMKLVLGEDEFTKAMKNTQLPADEIETRSYGTSKAVAFGSRK